MCGENTIKYSCVYFNKSIRLICVTTSTRKYVTSTRLIFLIFYNSGSINGSYPKQAWKSQILSEKLLKSIKYKIGSKIVK